MRFRWCVNSATNAPVSNSGPMRYFLHVRDGLDLVRDPDGEELEDVAAARHEAIETARHLMAQSLLDNEPLGLDRVMVISDESGAILAEVSFRAALPEDDTSR